MAFKNVKEFDIYHAKNDQLIFRLPLRNDNYRFIVFDNEKGFYYYNGELYSCFDEQDDYYIRIYWGNGEHIDYSIRSGSRDDYHLISWDEYDGWLCSCEHQYYRKQSCKHQDLIVRFMEDLTLKMQSSHVDISSRQYNMCISFMEIVTNNMKLSSKNYYEIKQERIDAGEYRSYY